MKRVLAGLTDIHGPGVEIVLNDRKKDNIMPDEMFSITDFIVHDSDLLEVVNELKAAGAEAIGINGVRILGNSRISCGGPTINVERISDLLRRLSFMPLAIRMLLPVIFSGLIVFIIF